jgi:hypothetical protein
VLQKLRRRFGALDQCTGFAESGRRVSASFGAEHGRETEERDGGRRRLLTERKRKMGRGPAWAVPRGKRRRGDLVERDMEGTRTRPDVRQLRWSGGDGCWLGGVSIVRERGGARGPRRRAWADQGRGELGRARERQC